VINKIGKCITKKWNVLFLGSYFILLIKSNLQNTEGQIHSTVPPQTNTQNQFKRWGIALRKLNSVIIFGRAFAITGTA